MGARIGATTPTYFTQLYPCLAYRATQLYWAESLHKMFDRDFPKRIRYAESRARCPSIETDAVLVAVLHRRRQSRLPRLRATAKLGSAMSHRQLPRATY